MAMLEKPLAQMLCDLDKFGLSEHPEFGLVLSAELLDENVAVVGNDLGLSGFANVFLLFAIV